VNVSGLEERSLIGEPDEIGNHIYHRVEITSTSKIMLHLFAIIDNLMLFDGHRRVL
jgi:hypothetical protein